MASAAARRMCSGVSKSGSPTTRLTIDLPWRRSSLARSAAEVLGEGLMRRTRAAMRVLVTGLFPWMARMDGRNGTHIHHARPRQDRSGSIGGAYGEPGWSLAGHGARLSFCLETGR